MANTIKIKNSGTASAAPSSLEYGELGLNYADGKLFYKNSSNNIVQFTGAKGDTGATGAGGALGYWGSFWSTQDQTAAATGTAYAITFNNSDTANSGVTLSNSSRINFTNAGVYSFIFSIQFANADNKIEDANVWFKKNGTNIPASDTSFSIVESHGGIDGKAVGTVNLIQSLASGDYIELFWQTTDTDIRLEYRPAEGPAPAIPSVIFTAVQVMYTQLPSATVLDDFQNVTVPTPSSGDFLKYNGSAWVNDAIDLGTDTTGSYVSSLVAGSGITLSNNSGEGATPTVALTSNSVTVNGTSIALGGSGTIAANASTLTGTSLNSSVTGSSLTSVGTLTSLSVSGNVSVTGAVIDHVITNQQTASYTLVLADDGDLVEMNVGTANNLTVPADNTVNFPIGTSIDILQVGAGQTTIVATSGVIINRSTGLKLRTQWSAATLIKRAANTWVAIGDLSA
jgi:hypothetical protein